MTRKEREFREGVGKFLDDSGLGLVKLAVASPSFLKLMAWNRATRRRHGIGVYSEDAGPMLLWVTRTDDQMHVVAATAEAHQLARRLAGVKEEEDVPEDT